MTPSKELKGSLFILFSALMYATLPVLVKMAYAEGLSPESTLFLRYLFSFLLLVVLLVGIKREPLLTVTPLVIAQGVLLTAGGLLYFFALEYLSAGLATVIFFAHPALVAIMGTVIYKESLAPQVLAGLALALTGVFLLSGLHNGSSSPASGIGIVYALLACLCYAFYGLAGQKTVANGKPLSITATIALVAIFIVGPVYPQEAGVVFHLTWRQLLVTTSMACFNTLMAVLFFLKGLQQIGATRATLISTAEPVFCLILAYLILSETLTLKEIIGSGMVLASMFLAIRPKDQAQLEPEGVKQEHL